MRALRSHEAGGPETLVLDEIPDPAAGPGEVLIAVRAAALNYPDVLLIQDLYQMRPPRPFAPGSEVAGIIEAVGSGVAAFKPGDRVIGLVAWGGLAEKLVVPESGCIRIDDRMDFEDAAALMVTYATSHYALRDQGTLAEGETLIVLGASGGVGLAAVQLGKAFGAHVVAATSSPEKAELARAQGADATVVYQTVIESNADARAFSDALRAACPGGTADVVFDPIGGAYSEPSFRTLGWQGRHLVVGFTAGIPRLPLNLPLLKGSRIQGIFYGDFSRREPEKRQAYLTEIADLHAAGAIKPFISMRLPLDNASKGLAALQTRQSTGKVVITF